MKYFIFGLFILIGCSQEKKQYIEIPKGCVYETAVIYNNKQPLLPGTYRFLVLNCKEYIDPKIKDNMVFTERKEPSSGINWPLEFNESW